jgi:hypothetical protein
MVENLPPPNFSAPPIEAPVVVAQVPPPAQVQVNPTPVKPTPKPLSSERAWVPNAPARQWKWIVVHHSATPSGSAAEFDKMHRAKGWDELGYHFVIGNGTGSGNGEVEVGPRWPKQKWGAHAKTPDNRYNDYGIGICLVGNFDIERPTPQQMQSLAKLTAFLMRQYHISPNNILRHKDTKPTDCPGTNLAIAQVRKMATQILADAGEPVADDETNPKTASADDLLQDAPAEAAATIAP